ncbi:MAG: 2-hydroxy-3-oxopropionate reductase [Anaerolineae bacterium]|nr:2-hydroxy-3-oxopropionate reductase [Anaerolineae bacterium]
MADTKPTIGFIGLGIMGKPMARNLMRAGYPLIAYNRSRAPMDELAAEGAMLGASPADVAARADIVILMLPDSPDVEQVVFGPNGVAEGIRAGSLLIDMSSISPVTAVKVAEELGKKGVKVLDAPVSGGDVGARQATLSIMVGGPEDVFNEALPVFQALGKNIVLCGGHGAGQITKLCNQILVALQLEAVAEALVLGAKAGVDPAKIVQVISGGLARCGVLETRGMRIVNRDFAPGFRVRLHYKDLNNALAAAKAYEVPLPVTALVAEMFKRLKVAGRGDLDHSAITTLLEDLADTIVQKREE